MTNVRCSGCGLLNFASAVECKRCGQPLGADGGADERAGWWRADAAAEGGGAQRCGFCGYETTGSYCLRCKARVARPAAEDAGRHAEPRRGVAAGARRLKTLITLALVVGVGLGGYFNRHRVWYGPHAEYAVLVRDSELFREPLTVKAMKRLEMMGDGGQHGAMGVGAAGSDPASVLEARGLVRMAPVEVNRQIMGYVNVTPGRPPTFDDPGEPAVQREIMVAYQSAGFVVTPEGREEAARWTDTGDGSSWLVPIGRREVYRVHSVGGAWAGADGVETRDVVVWWRWVPEGVGEAFDVDGRVVASLPESGRGAVSALNLSSAKVYLAVARLERRPGGGWVVKELFQANHPDGRARASAL